MGFDLRYRRVSFSSLSASSFDVFRFSKATQSRQLITYVGPKIRYAPIERWKNFSIQSAWWIPVAKDLEGYAGKPWIDYPGSTWWTQMFNDFDQLF